MSLRIHRSGTRVDLILDRPEVANALDRATQRQLEDAWEAIERDGARVAVITGAGERAFCAGADMRSGDPDGIDYWLEPRAGGFGGISLRDAAVPVVARVNGAAIGGGFEMVLGCDIAIAADHARFGLPEVLVGRIPLDGGVTLLLETLPRKLAMDMLLTGRQLSATEALEVGLVNQVVPATDLDTAIDEVVERLLAGAPLAQRAVKQLAAHGRDHTHAATLRSQAVIDALRSRDAQEGPRAFRERRSPTWQGL
jgi:crotonobetainyl-CoA hydratase